MFKIKNRNLTPEALLNYIRLQLKIKIHKYRVNYFKPERLRFFPANIHIEISNICNLSCEYCLLKENMEHKTVLKPSLFNRLIPYFKYVSQISLSGAAEPLMNKNIFDYIRIIKEEGAANVSMITNATLLDADVAEKLVDLNIDSLSFSLDSNKEVNDEIRKGSSLKTIIDNIKTVQKIKKKKNKSNPELNMVTVLQKKNYQDLPDLIDLAKEMEVPSVSINGLEPYKDKIVGNILWGSSLNENPSQMKSLRDVLQKTLKRATQKNIRVAMHNLWPTQETRCFSVNAPYIMANGDVTACSALAYQRNYFFTIDQNNRDQNNRIENRSGTTRKKIFGSILENDLLDIWNKPEYVKFRNDVLEKRYPQECEHCLIKHQLICARSKSLNDLVENIDTMTNTPGPDCS